MARPEAFRYWYNRRLLYHRLFHLNRFDNRQFLRGLQMKFRYWLAGVLVAVCLAVSVNAQIITQVVNSIVATTCTAQFIRSLAASGAGTCATVSLTADVTGALPVANGGLAATSIPNFKVTLTGGNQSVTSGTITKVAFDTVAIDSGSFWSAANKNYLPTVAGTYMFCAQVAGFGTFTVGGDLAMFISKNGIAGGAGTALTSYQGTMPTATTVTQAMHDCTIVSMNGSSDTVEVDAAVTATSPAFVSNSLPQTYFLGWRISP
jgi:hypothetical protein